MPRIHNITRPGDDYEVIVHKDVTDQAAAGKLVVYATEADAAADRDPIELLESTWTSASSDFQEGKGPLARAASGKFVVATQAGARSEPEPVPGLGT